MIYEYVLENGILPAADRILGSTVMKNLRQLRRESMLDEESLERLSSDNLRKLLEFSTSQVPYYRDLKIQKSDAPETWLQDFPVLRKADLSKHLNQMASQDLGSMIQCKSSGSSGVQSTVYITQNELSVSRAIQLLWWEWAGYQIGEPLLQSGITPNRGVVKKIKDFLLRTNYFPAFHLSEPEILSVLDSLRGVQPMVFCGYASSLYVMAMTAEAHGYHDIQFTRAISWGDKLFPHYRSKIKEIFQADTYDTYGSAEHILLAAQKDLAFHYIMTPYAHLELLDDNDQPVPDGQIGHVVVTRLFGYGMPLIRYALGDLAVRLPKEEYPKHRQLAFPLLKQIIGRDTDIVTTPGGHYLVVHYFTGIFEHHSEIQQYQVVQNEPGGIEILYIPGANFMPRILETIESELRQYLNGEDFFIHFNEVTHIAPSPSGKPQFVQVNIDTKLSRSA
jgi:phenylacetate-CoA ligase